MELGGTGVGASPRFRLVSGENGIDDDRLLSEQVAYYRARADEYEFWWERSHQYELEPEARSAWDDEVRFLEAWVEQQRPSGHLLELACGTGIWTRRLARHVDRLTALDASPEVLKLNAARLEPSDGDRVEFIRADLFNWHPRQRYDLVFFSFWLSHVPPSRVPEFWATVRNALEPGGRVIFLDNRFSPRSWPHAKPDSYLQERTDLSSGERFHIVKRYLEPNEVEAELAGLDWQCQAGVTDTFFLYGTATDLRR
jgi:demethylmenaquinone methyltransferase/2-methoxy-6-polyprenyl-1,4-benzoquinol methylase